MEKHDEVVEQPVSEAEIEETELSEEELDDTSGGIIIVSGKPNFARQQLPPGPPNLNFKSLKNLGGN